MEDGNHKGEEITVVDKTKRDIDAIRENARKRADDLIDLAAKLREQADAAEHAAQLWLTLVQSQGTIPDLFVPPGHMIGGEMK